MSKSIIRSFAGVFSFLLVSQMAAQESLLGGCVVTFNLGDEVTLCSSTSVYALPAGNPSGGNYSGNGVLDAFFFPSIAGPGQHIITYSYDNGFCIGSASDTITVVTPIPITIEGDLEICYGESTTISALDGTDIEWESGSNENSETFSPETTTAYTVYGYDVHGCLAATGYTIIVHPLPQLVFEGDTSLCIGESTTIVVTGGNNFVWSNLTTGDTIEIEPQSDTDYSVTAESDYGCFGQDVVTVTVHEYPIVQITGDPEICSGEATMLMADGEDNYIWNTGEIGNAIIVAPSIDSTFSVVATSVHGCSTPDDFAIVVRSLPQISIEGDLDICVNETTNLVAFGGVNYSWDNGFDTNEINVSPSESMPFVVTATNEYDCENSASVFVVVHDLPSNVPTINDDLVCIGDTLQLVMHDVQNTFWYQDNAWLNSDTLTVLVTETSQLVTYYVEDMFGCFGNENDVVISANESPVLEILGDMEICENDLAVFTAEGALNYAWSNGSETDVYQEVLYESQTIVVTGSNEVGCSTTRAVDIIVHPSPDAMVLGDTHACLGDSVILTITGAESYLWSDGSEAASFAFLPEESTGISVQSTSTFGCISNLNLEIVVDTLPTVTIDELQTGCPGSFLTIHAFGAEDYIWNSSIEADSITLELSETTSYHLVGTDGNGCSAAVDFSVAVFEPTELQFEFLADTLCDSDEPVELVATPGGGQFYINGIPSTSFDPAFSNLGWSQIVYAYVEETGCVTEAQAELFLDDCTSILKGEKEVPLSLFPNPFRDEFMLQSESGIESICIHDTDGHLIFSNNNLRTTSITISIPDVPEGIYFLQIELQDGRIRNEKMLKQ